MHDSMRNAMLDRAGNRLDASERWVHMRSCLFALLLLASCKPRTAGVADAGEVTAVGRDVASAPTAPPPMVDLLMETEVKITVSSRVDNPRDYPEHLVDGRPETAWNGKTGDLNGWIEVEIAPSARVVAIAITAGFDKKKGSEDLFAENHRIKRLRVSRDGAVLKEVTLDTDERAPQSIPVDAAGGIYRLEVLETVPGTKKEWKELVVSDLKFYGNPGTARLAEPRLPAVSVAPGSAPAPKAALRVDDLVASGREAKSVRALCEVWNGDVDRTVKLESPGAGNAGPYCREISPLPSVEGALPSAWKKVHAVAFARFNGIFVGTAEHLVIELEDGTLVVGPDFRHYDDLGCASETATVAVAFRIVGGTSLAIARAEVHPQFDIDANSHFVSKGGQLDRELRTCSIAAGRLSCEAGWKTLDTIMTNADELDAFGKNPRLRWQ
jgi:hypothetical protein